MPLDSPERAFASAQDAMERGDWGAFFECLDRNELLRIAKNAIPTGEQADDAYVVLCIEHGIPRETLEQVKAIGKDISASAQAMLPMWTGDKNDSVNQENKFQLSLRHRNLVKALDVAIETCLKSATDLAVFVTRSEEIYRAKMGGGSVSSTLFVGETLVDVTVEGSKASGTRQLKTGWTEPIAFARKKVLWYIKFLPKSGSLPRSPCRPVRQLAG